MKYRHLVVGLACMASVSALAEEQKSGFELAVGAGKYFYDNELLDSASMPVLSLGYQFNNSWQLELIHARPDTNLNSASGDIDVDWGALRAMYLFDGASNHTPYLSAGYADMDVFQGERDVVVGAGLKVITDSNLIFRVEGNYHTGEGDMSVLALLGYRFGDAAGSSGPGDRDMDGVTDNLDACPKTPRGDTVDARGCTVVAEPEPEVMVDEAPVDTDGDGVVDSMDKCPNTPAGALVDANGCQKQLEKDVSVELKVNFATNSSVVEASYNSELAKVAEFMKQYAGTNVVIEGHTDSTGSAAYNQTLSERRAASVAKALADRFGIDAGRISSVGYGEDRPIADNDTVEGRSANRRVVAVIRQTVKENQWQ